MKPSILDRPPKPPCITHRELGLAMLPELHDDIVLAIHQLKIAQQRLNYVIASLNTKEPKE